MADRRQAVVWTNNAKLTDECIRRSASMSEYLAVNNCIDEGVQYACY